MPTEQGKTHYGSDTCAMGYNLLFHGGEWESRRRGKGRERRGGETKESGNTELTTSRVADGQTHCRLQHAPVTELTVGLAV